MIDYIFAHKNQVNHLHRKTMLRNLFRLMLLMSPAVMQAQDTLPNISVTDINNNILISWTNPFTSLTNIKIQRSFDSTRNFTTIGSVLNVFNRTNGFVDAKPPFNKMYYRIFLSFEGGSYIFSESSRPVIDTSRTLIYGNDNQVSVNTWFAPSKRVFTGKDNNVVISLPDAVGKKYSVKFYEENGAPVFEIAKITEPYLTIEKVNFMHAGLFTFEIYDGELLVEKYKFYIPRDGKPVPTLYEQGKRKF